MRCPYPISIPKPNGLGASDRITVPCGTCPTCLISRREEWAIRLMEEFKATSAGSCFVTLTYDEITVPVNNEGMGTVVKSDVQKYIHALRKVVPRQIRYYAVGEYGTNTFRPHYHIILFNVDFDDYINISTTWKLGFVSIGEVNDASIQYVAKYHVNRTHYPEGCDPPFALMSKGIGRAYLETMSEYHQETQHSHYQMHEFKKKLPRYYKDKIFSNQEKERINDSVPDLSWNLKEIKAYDMKYGKGSFFKYKVTQQKNFDSKFKEKVNYKNTL